MAGKGSSRDASGADNAVTDWHGKSLKLRQEECLRVALAASNALRWAEKGASWPPALRPTDRYRSAAPELQKSSAIQPAWHWRPLPSSGHFRAGAGTAGDIHTVPAHANRRCPCTL